MDKKLATFTKYLLDFMLISGIGIVATLPFSFRFLGERYIRPIQKEYLLYLIVFGIAGIFGILIVYELRKMIKSVLAEHCFVRANVKSLNAMAAYSMGIFGLFLVKLLWVPTWATAIILLVFFIAAVFSRVLSQVFLRAILYKEETDFTI